VLFTAPGERVMRPDFGSGVRQLVFAPASQPLAISTEMTVSAAVTEHLGDLVTVDRVGVELGDGRLTIDVVFTLRETGERRAVQLEGPAP
jgi:phage baseplate assembly protein W